MFEQGAYNADLTKRQVVTGVTDCHGLRVAVSNCPTWYWYYSIDNVCCQEVDPSRPRNRCHYYAGKISHGNVWSAVVISSPQDGVHFGPCRGPANAFVRRVDMTCRGPCQSRLIRGDVFIQRTYEKDKKWRRKQCKRFYIIFHHIINRLGPN